MKPSKDGETCDCAHHRRISSADAGGREGRWAAVVPILTCAVCPACLPGYAKLLAFLGVGISLKESTHHVLLASAIFVSLAVSAWRGRRLGRWGPFATVLLGSSLLGLGHMLQESRPLLWGGVAVLLGGTIWERSIWKRSRAAANSLRAGGVHLDTIGREA